MRVLRAPQGGEQRLVPEGAGDAGEGAELAPLRPGRQEQEADEVDRPAVDRLEVDRPLEPGEQPVGDGDPGQAGVRDRGAAAHARRAEPLALQQLPAQRGRVQAQRRAGAAGQGLDHARLVGRPQAREHAARSDEVSDAHRPPRARAQSGAHSR